MKSQGVVLIAAHNKTVFGPLLKTLAEARYEHFVLGTEKEHYQEKLLVESMQVGAHNLLLLNHC